VSIPVIEGIKGSLSQKEPFIAQILSDKSIKLSTKLAGYIEKVYVEESQKVKRGDKLVSIDAVELRSTIEALKSTLRTQRSDLLLAKNIHERNKKLYNIGGLAKEKLEISALGVESKASQVESTKQKIDQLNHQLSYLGITAPFDGVIDALLLHEGDLAAAGKPILSMSNGKKKLVFAYAPTQANSIHKTQKIIFEDQEIGSIKSLYTTSSNGLLRAEVALSKVMTLPAGTSINIEVLTKEAEGCILPANTIVHKKEGSFVMLYSNKKFVPQKVEIAMQNAKHLLLQQCPAAPVAYGNEVKLAQLPVYSHVNIIGATHE
jgi:RND family efflux transporter MFP subunit